MVALGVAAANLFDVELWVLAVLRMDAVARLGGENDHGEVPVLSGGYVSARARGDTEVAVALHEEVAALELLHHLVQLGVSA